MCYPLSSPIWLMYSFFLHQFYWFIPALLSLMDKFSQQRSSSCTINTDKVLMMKNLTKRICDNLFLLPLLPFHLLYSVLYQIHMFLVVCNKPYVSGFPLNKTLVLLAFIFNLIYFACSSNSVSISFKLFIFITSHEYYVIHKSQLIQPLIANYSTSNHSLFSDPLKFLT